MNKGINRNVIEIVDTDNEVFERAILFVRPQGREQEPDALERSARHFLFHTKIRRRILPDSRKLVHLAKYACAAVLGAGAAVLMLTYILPTF